jgi:WhiB family transcriptional regulator, redox-sensing transcriptional regulator
MVLSVLNTSPTTSCHPLEDLILMTTQTLIEMNATVRPIASSPVIGSTTMINPISPMLNSAPAQPNVSTTPVKWDVDRWRADAACSDFDTNMFFPDVESDEDVRPQITAAKGICAACPVRHACLEFAIRTRQLDGVWGGHTPEERRSIRRRRQAAARKASAAAA